jgi:drug/metabolite transporter (DMT)-like permease
MAHTSTLLGFTYAVSSGLAFALLGVAYRTGAARGVAANQIITAVGLAGALFFGSQVRGGFESISGKLWALGVVAGVTQYLTILLLGLALKWGPLSPVWSATMLSFVPVAVYGWAALGEPLSGVQLSGVAAGVLCVITGACQRQPATAEHPHAVRFLPYAATLSGVFLLNAVGNVALKHVGSGAAAADGTMLGGERAAFLTVMFISVGLCTGAHSVWREGLRRPPVRAVAPVLLAVLGSLSGNLLLAAGVPLLPAAAIFTSSSIASILGAALISVLVFQERAGRAWWTMMACGLAAVVLLS